MSVHIRVDNDADNFVFTASDESGHTLVMDAAADQGGEDKGFRPMQTLLAALVACSGIDIKHMLLKQGYQDVCFSTRVMGEREDRPAPSLWKYIHLTYTFPPHIPIEKARNAVKVSYNRYCSMAKTLRRAGAEIVWTVVEETAMVAPARH